MIEETNISRAWIKAVERADTERSREITPLVLTLTGFDETKEVRDRLDKALEEDKINSVDTVAETIFPTSLYRLCRYNRKAFYNEYIANLPRIHRIDKRNNRGTYFERLIAFDGHVNQLEIIINSLQKDKSVRRSKLQAAIFDPAKDHLNGPYQGFPCLQHVTFYVTKDGGLVLNSFYAIQLLYQKAYGNWLGLTNLGKFVAKEAGLELERFNCHIGIEQLEIPKAKTKGLILHNDVLASQEQG